MSARDCCERLEVGVDGDELDALDLRLDHAVDGVDAGAADARRRAARAAWRLACERAGSSRRGRALGGPAALEDVLWDVVREDGAQALLGRRDATRRSSARRPGLRPSARRRPRGPALAGASGALGAPRPRAAGGWCRRLGLRTAACCASRRLAGASPWGPLPPSCGRAPRAGPRACSLAYLTCHSQGPPSQDDGRSTPPCRRVVFQHRHALHGRLREANRLADPRGEDAIAEVLLEDLDRLLGVDRAGVDERRQDALDLDVRVEVLADHGQRVLKLDQPTHRQILALDGDDNLVGGRQRVDREQPEARRRVDADEVVVVAGSA